MAVRELAERLNCSTGSAANYLAELDDAKLAHPTRLGIGLASERHNGGLRFFLSHGELPITQWEEHVQHPVSKPPLSNAERQSRYRERCKTVTKLSYPQKDTTVHQEGHNA